MSKDYPITKIPDSHAEKKKVQDDIEEWLKKTSQQNSKMVKQMAELKGLTIEATKLTVSVQQQLKDGLQNCDFCGEQGESPCLRCCPVREPAEEQEITRIGQKIDG